MDFDDLDEQQDVAVNNQPAPGTILPLMKRSIGMPDVKDLPMKVQQRLPPLSGVLPRERQPKLRLLCLMGCADNVCQEWCFMADNAPDDFEVGVYELPGHGVRAGEDILETMAEVGDDAFETFREAMDTGPFALLAHSIGGLFLTHVAERAFRELRVQPLFVIIFDRGAPHLGGFSEYGEELLRTDPKRWYQITDPSTAKSFEIFPQSLHMWATEMLMQNDTRPVGWFKFTCPIIVFRQEPPAKTKENIKIMAENGIEVEESLKINSNHDHLGHWDQKECQAWDLWTDHPKKTQVVAMPDTTHIGMKSNAVVWHRIWRELQAVVDAF